MPMPPRPQCMFLDGQFSPPKSIPMPIRGGHNTHNNMTSHNGHGHDDDDDAVEERRRHQQHGWPFHSFSAPCPAAGYLDEIFAAPAHHQNYHPDEDAKFSPVRQYCSLHCGGGGGNIFVRSQSESAALNKLAQQRSGDRRRPCSLLDEFQIHSRLHQMTGGKPANGYNTAATTGPNGRREVKFFAQLPAAFHHSDSEGEDSLVSSPDEASPSNSCNEEEPDEHEQQQYHHIRQMDSGKCREEVVDKFLPPVSALHHDDYVDDNYEEEEEEHEEEDLGLGPMDEDIERDRDRMAAHSDHCIIDDSGVSPLEQQQMPPLPPPPPSCDYMTVPRMLATMDMAAPQPVQPMFVQLLPLVSSNDISIGHPPHPMVLLEEKAAPIEPTAAATHEQQQNQQEEEDEVIPLMRKLSPPPPSVVVSKTRARKCVRFADDCGKCLETVRVMTEPSDYPPKISPAVIRRYRRAAALAAAAAAQKDGGGQAMAAGAKMMDQEEDSDEMDSDDGDGKRPRSTWKLGFKQPASEYVKFRETLEHQKVALENVMLKNEQGRMIGTIKVANIAYEKRVSVRYSADAWRTMVDKPAQYQSSPSKTFDTFRFDIEIPRNESQDSRLEFCILFRTSDGAEYWDSNGGRNFVLVSPEPAFDFGGNQPAKTAGYNGPALTRQQQNPQTAVARSQPRNIQNGNNNRLDRDDAYRMDWNSPTGWSSTNFASWRQLSTEGPYW